MGAEVIDEHNSWLFLHVVRGVIWDRIFVHVIKHDLVIINVSVTVPPLLRYQVLLLSSLACGEGVVMTPSLLLTGLVSVR